MLSASVSAKRAPAKKRTIRRGWWGEGPPPWERWPGVSRPFEAVWVKTRNRWESVCGKYFYDQAESDRAVAFFPKYLTLTTGPNAGAPMVLMPYQEMLIVRPLAGWKRVEDGQRRFNKVFLAVPKGNAKTPLGAGLTIYFTFSSEGYQGEESFIASGDKDQARVLYDDAKKMVDANPALTTNPEGPRIETLANAMVSHQSLSSIKLVSSKGLGKHGKRPKVVALDELHALRDRELFEAFRRSMGKSTGTLFLMLTHAGDDDESICYEEWDYCRRLLSGEIADDSYLFAVFEGNAEEDPHDPKVWGRLNPGLGTSLTWRFMQDESTAAKNERRKLRDFLVFNQNRWINDAVAWFSSQDWDASAGVVAPDEQLQKLVCAGGIDGAEKNDLFAFVLAFKHPLDGKALTVEVPALDPDGKPIEAQKRSLNLNYAVTLMPFFWIPEDTMRRHEESDKVPYSEWRKAGILRVTPGAIIDHDQIFEEIVALAERFPMLKQGEIGYDPAKVTQLALALQKKGFKIAEVKQNFSLSEPSHMFEALVGAKRVYHGGHRVLRWNVLNTVVKRDDGGRIRPMKPKRQTKRIDGTIGSIIAISRLHLIQPPVRQSYKVFTLQ